MYFCCKFTNWIQKLTMKLESWLAAGYPFSSLGPIWFWVIAAAAADWICNCCRQWVPTVVSDDGGSVLPFAIIGVAEAVVADKCAVDGINGPDDDSEFLLIVNGGDGSWATDDLLDVVKGGEKAVGGGTKIPELTVDPDAGLSSRETALIAEPSPSTLFTLLDLIGRGSASICNLGAGGGRGSDVSNTVFFLSCSLESRWTGGQAGMTLIAGSFIWKF